MKTTSVRAHIRSGRPVRGHYRVTHAGWESGFTTLGSGLSREQAMSLAKRESKNLYGLITVYDADKRTHRNVVKQYYKEPRK
jgi:hypothetical protein